MIAIRRADERGVTRTDWLDSRHSFSFGEYRDPNHRGFGDLVVINEDWVAPGAGFATHGHRDMEILTYVLEGALAHRDSLGNGSVIRPGEVQRMTAGTGIRHSEFNHSAEEVVHLLQIWIKPKTLGLSPGYQEARFHDGELTNRLRLIAAPNGEEGAVVLHQDARVFAGRLGAGTTVVHQPSAGRRVWVQVARGGCGIDGVELNAGDGVAISEPRAIGLVAREDCEVLLFDLR